MRRRMLKIRFSVGSCACKAGHWLMRGSVGRVVCFLYWRRCNALRCMVVCVGRRRGSVLST